jgi:hypothetical protein
VGFGGAGVGFGGAGVGGAGVGFGGAGVGFGCGCGVGCTGGSVEHVSEPSICKEQA